MPGWGVQVKGIEAMFKGFDSTSQRIGEGLLKAGLRFEAAVKVDRRVDTGADRSSWTTRKVSQTKVVVGSQGLDYPQYVGGKGMSTGHRGAGDAHLRKILKKTRGKMMAIMRKAVKRGR